jgi:arylsulfatase A-like enzyme
MWMKRRVFLKGFPAVLAGPALFNSLGRASPSVNPAIMSHTSGMNVLFINIDDMAANAVGCYGNPTVRTPHLDRFATMAIRFARCYCQVPMCDPSRISFLTGLRPDSTHIYDNADPIDQCLPAGTQSLPELLRQYGIHSVSIGELLQHPETATQQLNAFDRLEYSTIPNGYEGESQGLPSELREALATLPRPRFTYSPNSEAEQRMAAMKAERDELCQRANSGSEEYGAARRTFQQSLANIFGDSGRLAPQESDGQKARLASHILGQLARQKTPFFMSLSFTRPHIPLCCPGQYLNLYDASDIGLPQAPPQADIDVPAVAKRFGCNEDIFNSAYTGPVTNEAARQAIRAYYGCVSFIDAQIGIVLEALERENLSDDTIVIISSDHGFQLGEHGLWSKDTLFEQSTHVPLMVRVPGLTRKETACDEIVELVDLLPTICEFLAIPLPDCQEGTSFAPLFADPHQPWKLAAFSICSMADHVGRSVRTKRWRYTDWQSRKTSLRQFELYDLHTDPWEQRNLAQSANCRNQRTILANLLQRGWHVAHQRGAAGPATPAGFSSHRAEHILW